jgi:predicted nuclease with RNAse H fold
MAVIPLTYVGIDIANGPRAYTLAVLDSDLKLLAMTRGEETETLGYCAGQTCAVAAINAPSHLNCGSMNDLEFRAQLLPPPPARKEKNMRRSDYELRLSGISITPTPATLAGSPIWMRRGLQMYRSLENLGYTRYSAEISSRQFLECQAEAAFYRFLGQPPFEGNTLEGRLQRQLALFERNLPVSNPMNFFEEVTRYKLLHSILPVEKIHSSRELNALCAAYTAWLVFHKPDQVERIGEASEGEIFLPIISESQPHASEESPKRFKNLRP